MMAVVKGVCLRKIGHWGHSYTCGAGLWGPPKAHMCHHGVGTPLWHARVKYVFGMLGWAHPWRYYCGAVCAPMGIIFWGPNGPSLGYGTFMARACAMC